VYSAAGLERRSGRTHAVRLNDLRTPFAHDRDRILYSTAFRRLAGKTQVVAVQEHGLYHTRLTHSLKVAQLGRRLAERLQGQYLKQTGQTLTPGQPMPADPDLAETCCLAHDIGHPPFGHVGEEALKDEYDRLQAQALGLAEIKSEYDQLPPAERAAPPGAFDDYLARVIKPGGFEGNAQSLRVLCYLSARRPIERGARYGLDLTRATLDGATKYPRLRVGDDNKVEQKFGAIEADAGVIPWVRAAGGLGPDAPMAFEAQLMDWCDDVTYAVHDVMDFYRGGSIPLDRLFAISGGPKARALSTDAQRFLKAVRRNEEASGESYDADLSEAAWLELAKLNDLYDPWEPTLEVKATVQAVTSDMITFLVDGVAFEGDAPCERNGVFTIDADADRQRLKRRACNLLKSLLWVYVIDRPAFATVQRGQDKIVRELLDVFASDERLLPQDRREDMEHEGADLLRAACDHVASLTESDAVALHQRLMGVNLGAITDALQ